MNKAFKFLKEEGILKADKKLNKEVNEGAIGVMVSPNRHSSTIIEVKIKISLIVKLILLPRPLYFLAIYNLC